jgi:hypothetical protein
MPRRNRNTLYSDRRKVKEMSFTTYTNSSLFGKKEMLRSKYYIQDLSKSKKQLVFFNVYLEEIQDNK